MLSYILKVTLCWAALYVLFHLLMRRETFFQLNRWYLLWAAMLGLLIPAIDLQFFMEKTAVVPVADYLQPVTVGVEQLEAVIITAFGGQAGFDWWQFLTLVYFVGVAAALARFVFGLRQIFRLYHKGTARPASGYRFVSTPAEHVPFSFFNHLFWSEKFRPEAADRAAILRHEEAHIFQKHSFDVVFMELLGVFFWCSPPIYFFQKAVKTNHEYLADEAALKNASRKNYGRLLLRQFQPSSEIALSNSLFSSQLKNRIIMMTKTKSTKSATLKYLIGLPLLALLILAFSFAGEKPKTEFEGKKSPVILTDTVPGGEVYKVVEEMPRFPGCEDVEDAFEQKNCWQKKMLEFIYTNLQYPEEARKNDIEGMVVVNFIIEKDGSIADAEIKRAIGGGCEEEVLRMVYTMPKWVPGKQNGEAVRVAFNLPVKFKLDPKGANNKMDVDEMPLFAEGCENLNGNEAAACSKKQLVNFIIENLKYPEASKKAGTEGTVLASFTVDKNGYVADPKILRSLDEQCDAEVLRILEDMPKWTPGMKGGKAVAVELKLPFKFALPINESALNWKKEARNMAKEMEVFQVYPNPASEKVFINFKSDPGTGEVRLTDVHGKVLASKKIEHDGEEQTVEFDTGKLPRGTVLITIFTEEKRGQVIEVAKIVLK